MKSVRETMTAPGERYLLERSLAMDEFHKTQWPAEKEIMRPLWNTKLHKQRECRIHRTLAPDTQPRLILCAVLVAAIIALCITLPPFEKIFQMALDMWRAL